MTKHLYLLIYFILTLYTVFSFSELTTAQNQTFEIAKTLLTILGALLTPAVIKKNL